MAYDMMLGRETSRDWSCGVDEPVDTKVPVVLQNTNRNIENTFVLFLDLKGKNRVSPRMDEGFTKFLNHWKNWRATFKQRGGLFHKENRDALKLFQLEGARWQAQFMSLRTVTPTESPRDMYRPPRTVYMPAPTRAETAMVPSVLNVAPMPKWPIFLAVGLGAALLGIFAGKP